MKLSEEVCSLEMAIKLKELGILEESVFVWEYVDEKCYGVKFIPHAVVPNPIFEHGIKIYPAYNASELINILPPCIDIKTDCPFNYFWLQIEKRTAENIKYIVRYLCDSIPGEEINNPHFKVQFTHTYSSNLSDALAKMIIYLIEEKLIEIPKD